jgi:protein phosphatase 2C family protein 2/3
MEDAHTTILDLIKEIAAEEGKDGGSGGKKISFFGVYDGHGGSAVAQFCGKKLHKRIRSDKEFEAGDYKKAITKGFLGADEDLENGR